jgi:catechol 2,3-dioxygenase-like lactoylglutathione lyase family enzyme
VSGFSRTSGGVSTLRWILLLASAIVVCSGASGSAQLSSPNVDGVAMGHLHYHVRDVEANKRFWIALGGKPVKIGANEVVKFPDVIVFLTARESSGGTEGSVVNHVAFRVPSFKQVEAAGLAVQRLAQFPGVGSTMSPEGERIELFEDAALNLTFTADDGRADPVALRHNRPVPAPIAFHHVHLYLPGEAHLEAKAWYARMFGGIPGKRAQYDAVDLPGINLNFSGGRSTAPTKGRMLDHIGFEVRNLEAFCKRLGTMGVRFDVPYGKGSDGVARAAITDPWGTSIELTEGLRAF